MRANDAAQAATSYLQEFKLDEAAKRCYEFVWSDLADWYVEAVKPRLTPDAASPSAAAQRAPAASGDAASVAAAHAVLTYCFDAVLRLLHPVVPFITEELWQKLPGRTADELLASAAWPARRDALTDPRAEARFALVQDAIAAIRTIRAEYRVSPKARLAAPVASKTPGGRRALEGERD